MYKIENLSFKYEKNKNILKNINMDLSNGDIIGIIGENGCGKSTLFMNMTGILKPESGEIIYNNEKIKYGKKDLYNLRKRVGMVFQDPEKQIFYSKVYDDIAFTMRNIGMDEEEIKLRIEKALASVNGEEFIDKPVQFLSYGQKKRVAIASVIAMQNETVLLDEPTSGLDPRSTDAVVDIIKNMKKNGKKVVISSHDMDLIYEICDYVYVMNKGEIIKEGNPDDVFTDEEMIKNAGLKTPWIIKIYKELKNNKTNNNETNLETIKTKFAQYK